MPLLRQRPLLALAVFAAASVASALGLAAAASGPSRPAAPPPPAYISLGDSLAAGLQPDAKGVDRPSGNGYADIVGRRLRHTYPGLVTRRLSCGGATTVTLLHGGAACQGRGDAGQLVQAERFLAAHPETRLVTVNIGDNDVEGCLQSYPPSIDYACVRRGRATIRRNLPQIAARLRRSAPRTTPVVGILDYDQFLALWLDGPHGRAIARRSVSIITELNALMARIYRAAGVRVADAGGRFETTDLSTMTDAPGIGRVPLAVARICAWTWACSGDPIGHDDHARTVGYAQIAAAVLDAIGRN